MSGISTKIVSSIAGKLAPTVFSTGPQNRYAVSDVYSQNNNSVINSFQDMGGGSGLNVLGALRGTSIASIASMVKGVADGKLKLDPVALASRIIGNNSQLSAAFRNIDSAVLGAVRIPGNMLNAVTATVGNTVNQVIGGNVNDARGFGEVINNLSGGNYPMNIVDKGAMSGVVSEVCLRSSEMGLPKAFSSISSGITDQQILSGAMGRMMPDIVRGSNVNLFMDVASTPVGKLISKVYPDVVRDMTRTLTQPLGMPQNQYSGLYSNLSSSFAVADPYWNTSSRSGSQVVDAYKAGGGGGFFSQILRANAFSQTRPIDTNTLYRVPSTESLDRDIGVLSTYYGKATSLDRNSYLNNTTRYERTGNCKSYDGEYVRTYSNTIDPPIATVGIVRSSHVQGTALPDLDPYDDLAERYPNVEVTGEPSISRYDTVQSPDW